jgi:hypothetical protein
VSTDIHLIHLPGATAYMKAERAPEGRK